MLNYDLRLIYEIYITNRIKFFNTKTWWQLYKFKFKCFFELFSTLNTFFIDLIVRYLHLRIAHIKYTW